MNGPFKILQYERLSDKPVGERPYSQIWLYKDLKNTPRLFPRHRAEVQRLLKIVEIPPPLDGKFDEIIEKARSTTVLSDETILRVLDVEDFVSDQGRRLILVLDNQIGLPLNAYKDGWFLPVVDALTSIFFPVLDALSYAHRQYVCHGNLKPSNVIVLNPDSPSPQIKVMDFGTGRLVPASSDPRVKTWSDLAAAYKAPEQHNPTLGPTDHLSDVFAAAVMLLELITGDNPYASRRSDFVEPRQLQLMLAEHPGIPQPLAEVLLQALARDREQRLQSAEALKQALMACIAAMEPGEQQRSLTSMRAQQNLQVPVPSAQAGPKESEGLRDVGAGMANDVSLTQPLPKPAPSQEQYVQGSQQPEDTTLFQRTFVPHGVPGAVNHPGAVPVAPRKSSVGLKARLVSVLKRVQAMLRAPTRFSRNTRLTVSGGLALGVLAVLIWQFTRPDPLVEKSLRKAERCLTSGDLVCSSEAVTIGLGRDPDNEELLVMQAEISRQIERRVSEHLREAESCLNRTEIKCARSAAAAASRLAPSDPRLPLLNERIVALALKPPPPVQDVSPVEQRASDCMRRRQYRCTLAEAQRGLTEQPSNPVLTRLKAQATSALVDESMAKARSCLERKDFRCARAAADAGVAWDPGRRDARELKSRVLAAVQEEVRRLLDTANTCTATRDWLCVRLRMNEVLSLEPRNKQVKALSDAHRAAFSETAKQRVAMAKVCLSREDIACAGRALTAALALDGTNHEAQLLTKENGKRIRAEVASKLDEARKCLNAKDLPCTASQARAVLQIDPESNAAKDIIDRVEQAVARVKTKNQEARRCLQQGDYACAVAAATSATDMDLKNSDAAALLATARREKDLEDRTNAPVADKLKAADRCLLRNDYACALSFAGDALRATEGKSKAARRLLAETYVRQGRECLRRKPRDVACAERAAQAAQSVLRDYPSLQTLMVDLNVEKARECVRNGDYRCALEAARRALVNPQDQKVREELMKVARAAWKAGDQQADLQKKLGLLDVALAALDSVLGTDTASQDRLRAVREARGSCAADSCAREVSRQISGLLRLA